MQTPVFTFLASVLLLSIPARADVVDRIAAAINNRAIKESQVERDMRLTAFLNGTPLEQTAAAKHKAADRLIDQTVIRAEIAKGSYPAATDADIAAVLAKIKQARFHSNAEYEQSLKAYGISEPELKSHIAWQIQVLRFARPAVRAKALPPPTTKPLSSWLDAIAQNQPHSISRRGAAMTRPKRIILWIAGSLAGLVLLLGLTALVIVRTDWFRNYIRTKIITYAEEATGGTVDLKSFGFDWTHVHANLTGFVLHGTEPPAPRRYSARKAST